MSIFNLGKRHSDQGGMLRNEGWGDRQFKKVIQWYNKDRETMSYRYDVSHAEIMDGTCLIVQEGQVALLSNDGIIEVFEAGRYELTTDNKPVTSSLKNIFFKFENTHKQTVYFVTTRQFIGNKWGTKSPVALADPQHGNIQIRAFGSFMFKIGDPKAFYLELSGSDKEYNRKVVSDQLSSMIEEKLGLAVRNQGVTASVIGTRLKNISDEVEEMVAEEFRSIGLEIKNVIVESVTLPDDVQEFINMETKSNIADRMSHSGLDKMQRIENMKNMRTACEKDGVASAMMQSGMGFGMGMYGSRMMGEAVASAMQVNQQPQVQPQAPGKFCPECGTKGEQTAKFCLECGHKFTTSACSCGAEIKPGQKFCMECGSKL